MKKTLSIILSLLLVLSVVSAMPFSAFAAEIRGDANGDGKVNMSDAVAIRLIDAGMMFPSDIPNYSAFGADANHDDKVTIVDHVAICQHLVDLSHHMLIGAPPHPTDGKAAGNAGDLTLDLGGTTNVNAGDSFAVDVTVKLKDTAVKIMAVDIQFLIDAPLTCEEFDFTSSVLGHYPRSPKEGKCYVSPANDIIVALPLGDTSVTPSDNSVLFTLSVNVPASTPSGEYTIDIADRCQVFSDENGTMYRTSVNPLTVTVTNNNLLGSGTATDPYQIDNYSKLKAFADKVNTDGEKTANAVLTADIVCKYDPGDVDYAADWKPIGNSSSKYTGTFDGDGHTITGLTTPANCGNYAGLFGCVGTGGVVQNVNLEGGSITGYNDVGGIVGSLDGGTIQNCANASAVTGNDSVGGIVGWLHGGTVRNCRNTGAVTGHSDVGGIVGTNWGTVQNCYNTGAIRANSDCGGIAGDNSDTVQNCYNTGAISADSGCGGIAGDNSDTVQNCYNTGAISADSDCGGIAGTSLKTVQNCYNTGAVTGANNDSDVGGIVGWNFGTGGRTARVIACYNVGSVKNTVNDAGVGGITGVQEGYLRGTALTENCCYDRNAVTLSGATKENDWKVIGEKTGDTTETNVKALTTAQMTGENALSAMTGFADTDWLTKADSADESGETYYWYYPHLKGFNLDGSGAQLAADAIGAADWPAKVEVAVTWSGKESYTYNAAEQKPVVSSVTVGG